MLKLTKEQECWLNDRKKIDKELREAIEKDTEFKKLNEQEQKHQLLMAMLLTRHCLTGI